MAGVPVLASPLIEVEELLTRYDVGRVVTSVEPAVMGQAINAMLDDAGALTRMRRNALAACHADLSWEHEQRRLVDLYAQLPGLASPRPRLGANTPLASGNPRSHEGAN